MWVHSSSLIVMSTDGWFLFRLDTENHSSQLVPQYSTVTPHWPALQQRKPNHCRGQWRMTFSQGFSSYHSVVNSGWMRSDLCHMECPQFVFSVFEVGRVKPHILGKHAVDISLLLMCLSLQIISIHEMEAELTHWYLIVRSIFEECAATTDTRSPVESICLPLYDPRPLMCLHAVQSHLSVGDFSGLFSDWPRAELWWQIVKLMYLPPLCWQEAEAPSWSTGPHPSSRALFV